MHSSKPPFQTRIRAPQFSIGFPSGSRASERDSSRDGLAELFASPPRESVPVPTVVMKHRRVVAGPSPDVISGDAPGAEADARTRVERLCETRSSGLTSPEQIATR